MHVSAQKGHLHGEFSSKEFIPLFLNSPWRWFSCVETCRRNITM